MKIRLLTFLLFTCTFLAAQDFGEFDRTLLSKQRSNIDSTAKSELLQHYCYAHYSFASTRISLKLEYFQRIKIYDDQASDVANFEIPIYVGQFPVEDVTFVKATSYNLENGEVVETHLDKKQVYVEDRSEKYELHKFAVPNVKAGTIIEVTWHIYSPFIYTIPTFYFQHDMPTVESKFDIKVPGYMAFTSIPAGFIQVETYSKEVGFSDHHEKLFSFTAKDVPPMKKDDYVLNPNDYRSSVKYEILSTHFPGNNYELYSESWEQIGKNLMNDRAFGYQLTRKLKDLKDIISEAKELPENERIKFCYEYVKSNYVWDGNYSRKTSEGLKELLEKKSGNSAEINILLVNLLTKCGIEAYPLLTRLRYGGLLNTNFPSLTNLNYLIAYVPSAEGESQFLDATNKGMKAGQLPLHAINVAGIVVKKNEVEVLPMINPNKLESRSLISYEYDPETEKLKGKGDKRFSNYAAYKFRSSYKEEYEDRDFQNLDQDKALTSATMAQDNSVSIVEMSGMEDVDQAVEVKFTEVSSDAVQKIGDEVFIDATFGYGLLKNPFIDEVRDHPIFYNYRVDKSFVFVVTIPPGYEIISTPEDLNIMIEGAKVAFSHSSVVSLDKIIVKFNFKVNDPIILPSDYRSFQLFYEKFLSRSKEKIVLKKI